MFHFFTIVPNNDKKKFKHKNDAQTGDPFDKQITLTLI